MNLRPVAAALLVPFLVSACYGSAPPPPPEVPLPEVQKEAQLSVQTKTQTTIERVEKQAASCPAGYAPGSPQCVVTRYFASEPVTRTTTQAFLDGELITYAQFKVITDPQWKSKIERLAALADKCEGANIPRYIGLGLLLGGLVAGVTVKGSAGTGLLVGGLGGGAASYAAGYYAFGGTECNEADRLYAELNLSKAMTWKTVHGTERAEEMRELANQFNTAHGHPASAANSERSEAAEPNVDSAEQSATGAESADD